MGAEHLRSHTEYGSGFGPADQFREPERPVAWVGGGDSQRTGLWSGVGEEARPCCIPQGLGQPCWRASFSADKREHSGTWLFGSMFLSLIRLEGKTV